MKGRIFRGMVAGLCAALALACGGGGGGTIGNSILVQISVSPLSASVPAGTTQQFNASVTGTSNSSVTWQVNSVSGGNSTVGMISPSGLYTAPAAIPSPANVTLTAISQADTTKSASATITVTVVAVSLSPASTTVPAGAPQQFTATVTGSSNIAVNWQVNGTSGGTAALGTISSSGLYTAPLTPPPTGIVTVTAISQADPSKTALATVTIVFSDASLTGQYSFLLSGDDQYGSFLGVGSFTADGQGGLSSGFEDLNYGQGPDFLSNLSLSGTYTVGADGRGMMTLTNSLGTLDYALIVISNARARFVEYNTSANGEGLLLQRDPSAFSTAAINGSYAFGFGGNDSTGAPASLAGVFTADGAGNLKAGAEDANLGGTITTNGPLTGTYSVDATGRGTATINDALGTVHFVFHVVSKDTLFFVESDFPLPAVDGTAHLQSGPFSLSGDYALLLSGLTPTGFVATAGRFTSSSSGTISSGVLDENNSGTVSANTSFTGTDSVSSNGRGTAKLGSLPLAFYMVSPQEAFAISEDPNATESGTVLAQTGGPFTSSSASGSFGFLLFTSNTDTDQVGQGALGGRSSGTVQGTEDINDFRVLTTDAALSGSYSVSSNGRATASLTNPLGTGTFVFYVVSGSRMFVIQDDASSVTSGNIEKQY